MANTASAADRAAAIFRNHGGTLRMSDALELGISRTTLYGMAEKGQLHRLARGLYRLEGLPVPGDPDLMLVVQKVPSSVLCLVSALAFHNLTTEIPHEVQIAISRTSRYPVIEHPPVRVFRFRDEVLRAGVETHEVDGQAVRVFSPEKTIADCFKYRNKIGLDVALEGLRFYWQRRRPDINALMAFARLCRVNRIIRPYVEALA